MDTATKLVTADELFRMGDDQRCELVKGELRTMAPAGFEHGATVNTFEFLLTQFVREKRLGVVVGAETGFRLSRDPDTVRGVDAGFVRASRIPSSGRPIAYFDGAPDLAVEVLSPSDTVHEVEEKVDDYLSAGCPMVLVINPRRRTLTVYRPDANPTVLRATDVFDGQDVVPGFRCNVAEIFE